ncbi:MAG TPA: GTP-dependent dephospho-CoA kinase family protein [Methanocorpusculum sp.]|nr:GTP-dependent dephospho-CoA kinase family protein [Methanocorpusculum sp.]
MLTLPPENRWLFREPFGTIFSDFSSVVPLLKGKFFCTVGDVVTHNALSAGLVPSIGVIDGLTKRSPYLDMPEIRGHILHVTNPAGTITDDLISALRLAMDKIPCVVMVQGEEDLAVLPLTEILPDGAIILYGQPDEGIVVCDVNDDLRANAKKLLTYFVSL